MCNVLLHDPATDQHTQSRGEKNALDSMAVKGTGTLLLCSKNSFLLLNFQQT